MTIQNFIKEKPYLIWYAKNPDQFSNKVIIEAVLNYGNFKEVKKIISIK